ncbi:polymorphic toxin-type HINT domain-containing protein [Paenibacillus sp. JX-17]|uniref:Polymorphic toxin-type HINT domain-containing protein n=1 Tax=Paenibacillus lacisoli TaxID=3064525 RepID=A0ABT9CJH9_9BACL|nr:polymorphic toxin-type HINT domain-containing protein [Paenibacillus sp. JX-17]MDO7908784.1 polymorphic toxin-type HINT domain-containing protein [Paenibacillus sp. JX-17]
MITRRVESRNLNVGDTLVDNEKKTYEIQKIEIKKENVMVYNFRVKDTHNYFVSSLRLWTHNCTGGNLGGPRGRSGGGINGSLRAMPGGNRFTVKSGQSRFSTGSSSYKYKLSTPPTASDIRSWARYRGKGKAASVLDKLKSLIKNGKIKGNNIISKIDDNTQVIFRKDTGIKAHPIKPKYPNAVEHYNVEIQTKTSAGKWKSRDSYHIIVDSNGNIIDRF